VGGRFPVTAVCFGQDSNTVFSGGIDNTVYSWDLRKEEAVFALEGHADTVTYLALSPAGTHVLSNAMDNTVRAWDVRPFVPGHRCARVFVGARHGTEKMLLGTAWSGNGERVAAGSCNGETVVWSFESGQPEYVLPGHKGSVNKVRQYAFGVVGFCNGPPTLLVLAGFLPPEGTYFGHLQHGPNHHDWGIVRGMKLQTERIQCEGW
jgi:WD40 repeat protein